MHLDQQRIGAHGDCSFAHRRHEVRAANALAWIDHDRQVRFFFNDWHGRKIECVARIILERPNPALAEHQITILVREHVFPGQQPLSFREPYATLARSASPEDFWRLVVDGKDDSSSRTAATLARYDYVLVTDGVAVRSGADTGLELIARLPDATLLRIRR